jgi:type II secretory pathway component PulF
MLLMDIPMADALQLQRFEFSERWLIRHSFMGRAVARIATRVERGSSLGDAVADERVFSPYWLLLLRQSEAHGHVIQTLRNLAVMERDSSVYTPNLVIRPILALGLLASIATFLSQYILPTFAEVMERSEGDTGFLSIHGLQELEPLGWLGMVALLGMCFGPVRRTLGQGVETLPVIWSLTRLRCQTVVCSSLATMLSMGMPLDESLRAAALVARQPRYRNALTEAGRDPGESLARALDRYPALFSSPLRRLVLHGETFGNLPDMLAQASVWLSEEASQVQSRMRTLIQIGLTAATGLAVGYMCLTVMGGLMITVIDISSRGVLP